MRMTNFYQNFHHLKLDAIQDSMKTKIRLAMLELLADDHWIVRQEVLEIDALAFVLLFLLQTLASIRE